MGLVLLYRRTIVGVLWMVLFIGSVAVGSVGRSPIGPFILWLYDTVPIMSLYRSPQHLLLPIAFSIAGIAGIGYSILDRETRRRGPILQSVGVGLVTVVLLVWMYPFWKAGDLGAETYRRTGIEGLAVFRTSRGYETVLQILEKRGKQGRVLILPMSLSPDFVETEYQSRGQGSDPFVQYSPLPAIVQEMAPQDIRRYVDYLQEGLYGAAGDGDGRLAHILSELSIRYVLLRRDVNPHFGSTQKNGIIGR